MCATSVLTTTNCREISEVIWAPRNFRQQVRLPQGPQGPQGCRDAIAYRFRIPAFEKVKCSFFLLQKGYAKHSNLDFLPKMNGTDLFWGFIGNVLYSSIPLSLASNKPLDPKRNRSWSNICHGSCQLKEIPGPGLLLINQQVYHQWTVSGFATLNQFIYHHPCSKWLAPCGSMRHRFFSNRAWCAAIRTSDLSNISQALGARRKAVTIQQ